MKHWADLYQRVVDILSVLYWVIYTEIIQAAFFVMNYDFEVWQRKKTSSSPVKKYSDTRGQGERESER